VHEDFNKYGAVVGLTTVCVYGGAPMQNQEYALRRGVDVVVGTPGRVKDFVERGSLDLSKLRFRVLDEADEMLNMGASSLQATRCFAPPDAPITRRVCG
jgi:ATP-dependent RNA helicase DDX21